MLAHIGRGHCHVANDAGQFFINNTVITIFDNSEFYHYHHNYHCNGEF